VDDHTTSGAPTPDRLPPLPRRVAAGLVDLAVVSLATAVAAVATATRVAALRQPDGSVTFADADRQVIDGLTGPLSRGHLIGDTLWAYSTDDVITIIAAAAAACIVVGALMPRLLDGRSPGKFLFRMSVAKVDGEPAGIVRHVLRTLFSLVDLMPLVVPGLTGFAFAASNPERRRVADRLAGTMVVNRRSADDMVSAADALAPRARTVETEPTRTKPTKTKSTKTKPTRTKPERTRPERTRFVPTIRSATLVDHASTRTDTSLNTRPKPPDLDGDKAPRPLRAHVRAGTTPAGRNQGVPEPQPHGDPVDMNERHSSSEKPPPESTATPVPVEERSNNPYPKPVRRSRHVTEDSTLPNFDSLTLPESSLSDMPLTNNALFEALGLTPPGAAQPDPQADSKADEVSAHEAPRDADDLRADPPVIEERPRGAALARRTRRSTIGEAPGELTEKVVGPATARQATTRPTTAPAVTARLGSSPAPDKRAPIWSEDWDSWIYWDTTLKNWFRHDMQRGTWVPMEDT